MAVIRIARHRMAGQHKVTAQRGRHADLDTKLVRLAHFALADALDLGRMQTVELALVVALLFQQAMGQLQFVGEGGLMNGVVGDLAFNIAYDTAQPGFQPFRLAA